MICSEEMLPKLQLVLNVVQNGTINEQILDCLNEDILEQIFAYISHVEGEETMAAVKDVFESRLDYYVLHRNTVSKILDAIDEGRFDADYIRKLNFEQLYSLYYYLKTNDLLEEYITIKQGIEHLVISSIKKKEKIIISFIANYSSTWIGDELYQLLDSDSRFCVDVWVCANKNHVSVEAMEEEYQRNLDFFRNKGIKVRETYDLTAHKHINVFTSGDFRPDICIWLTPWMGLLENQIEAFPLSTLHVYIPYGFLLAENRQNTFKYDQYNQPFHNLLWRYYVETKFSEEMSAMYSDVKGTHTLFTGYPKMDAIYKKDEEFILWNELQNSSSDKKRLRIIYSPHHTVCSNDPIEFSTFDKNYLFMQYLAKKYSDRTVWIFRPHPQLKIKAIKKGIFKDEYEWGEYLKGWNTDNCRCYLDGEYIDMFKQSDLMISDCSSFMAEYLYVNKPMIFLEREEQRFNLTSEKIKEVLYCVKGSEYEKIEEVFKMILEDNDYKYSARRKLFDEKLNYLKISGNLAARNIYEDLVNELCKKM